VFGKHNLGLFWAVLLLKKKGFCQTKPKTIIEKILKIKK
jgi:hypothetical protein